MTGGRVRGKRGPGRGREWREKKGIFVRVSVVIKPQSKATWGGKGFSPLTAYSISPRDARAEAWGQE